MSGEEQCAISTLPTGNSSNEMVFSDQFSSNIKSGKHGSTHQSEDISMFIRMGQNVPFVKMYRVKS